MGKAEDTRFDEEISIPYLGNKAVRITDHLQYVIATHFDPETGSKYWLKKEKELNLDARKDITDFEDLKFHLSLNKEGRLQEFEDALRYLPIRDLVPKSQQGPMHPLWGDQVVMEGEHETLISSVTVKFQAERLFVVF
jgi:hypothetical protein